MIPESRAVKICIVVALAMLVFNVSVYRLEIRRATVQASAPCRIGENCTLAITEIYSQREQVALYPRCPWWIDAELWWREDCPMGAAPGLSVPEGLR